MTASALIANLARLRACHAQLAEAVERADDAAIRRIEGPRGASSLEAAGVLLGSAYDPAGEGARLAEEMAREPADLLVAIGFGLGHHLGAYRDCRSIPLVVYEPAVERLRAALSIGTEMEWIDGREVYWAGDANELGERFRELYTPGLRTRVFVHPSLMRVDPKAASEAVDRIGRAKSAADIEGFTRAAMGEAWSRRTVENVPKLLRDPSLSTLFGAFAGRPAVVAAAGPSLDRQLSRLSEARERVLVIAIGQSLGALRRAGVEPDLVHILDTPDVAHQISQSGDPSSQNLVLFPSVHPSLYELPVRSRFVAYPVTNRVGCWLAGLMGDTEWVLGGGTVAQSAVHIAAALGANPILLIGQDLAFTDGRVYASGSAYDMVSFRETGDGRFVFTGFDEKVELVGQTNAPPESPAEDLLWVEGWSGGRVPTSKGYASFIDHYGQVGRFLAGQGVRLVNCTEGGARIPGLEHQPFDEALASCPGRRFDPRRVIHARFDASPSRSAESLRQPIARARTALERLEREARAGLAKIAEAAGLLRRGPESPAALTALRSLARLERRLERRLARVPWLDALSECELQRDEAELRRRGHEVSPERCLDECRMLVRSVLSSVGRARDLLEGLDRRLDDGATACDAFARVGHG